MNRNKNQYYHGRVPLIIFFKHLSLNVQVITETITREINKLGKMKHFIQTVSPFLLPLLISNRSRYLHHYISNTPMSGVFDIYRTIRFLLLLIIYIEGLNILIMCGVWIHFMYIYIFKR